MPDRVRVLEAILDEDGKLKSLVVEQEDHTTRTLTASGGLEPVGDPDDPLANFIPIKDAEGTIKGYIGWSESDGDIVIWNGNLSQFGDEGTWDVPYFWVSETGIAIKTAHAAVMIIQNSVVITVNGSPLGITLNDEGLNFSGGSSAGIDGTDTPTTVAELADVLVHLGIIASHTIT